MERAGVGAGRETGNGITYVTHPFFTFNSAEEFFCPYVGFVAGFQFHCHAPI